MKYFTIIGNHDAIDPSRPGFGAVLTIFFHYKETIDGVYIFTTPDNPKFPYRQTAEKIKLRMEAEKKDLSVSIIEMDLENPIDFDLVYTTMLDETQTVIENNNIQDFPKIINITSGTPTMATCWVLLQKSGLISNAKLIQSFETKFQQAYGKTCQEVDLSIDDFPEIKTPTEAKRALNRVKREITILKKEKSTAKKDDAIPGLIGKSTKIREIKEEIIEWMDKDTHVLILGERGTGKDVVAKAIWDVYRKETDKEFHQFDCGQLESNLITSQLFGHEKGAFTGATQRKKGIVELVDGKMLFLNEVGNLSLEGQNNLLGIVEKGQGMRVGGDKPYYSHIQVVAATNKDVNDETIFKADLKDRFDAIIEIPPLRSRQGDIRLLIDYFLDRENKNVSFGDSVYKQLELYSWPGNVRELYKWIRQICRRYKDIRLSWADIPDGKKPNKTQSISGYDFPDLPVDSNDFIAKLRFHALEMAEGNKSKADRLLGLKDGTIRQWQFKREERN
ncbi:MAG: sigma 54-interacting transcriptional regulator [Candidatus Marinimicrobia bacterium]|nr:sigma 54-interacting transcriptional regulator [Candidatus Neomarinimicrobiota bacterium]